jgi:hypothetical protein
MPSFRSAFPSKWLKASDCQPPINVTIKSGGFEDVGTGSDTKRKLVLHFLETEQGLVLNKTNGDLIAAITGTEDYLEWIGSRICLFSAKVQFKDKLVDAIRVRPVSTRASRSPAAPPPPADPPGDEEEGPDTEVGF